MIIYQPPTRHEFTPTKVVLWSGLSDPATCALSEVQTKFLATLQVPEAWKVYCNFPYLPGFETFSDTFGPLSLGKASLHNFRQFLQASGGAYRRAARRHWQALRRATAKLVIIALSCGLEIMNNCHAADNGPEPRVHVIALGPVAWQAPRVPHLLVQGQRDYLSRLFFRTVDVVLPGVGHMAYFQHPQVLTLVNDYLCGSISK